MTFIALAAFTVVVALIGVVIGLMTPEGSEIPGKAVAALSGIIGVAALLGLTACSSFHSVDAGNVGVVYTFGAITNQTGSGLVTTAPWQDVTPASIQIQKYVDPNVQAASKETQNVAASVTVNYQVSPVAIQGLYRNVGPKYQDILIPSRVSNFFKEEAVRYTSTDVIPNRETIRTDVRDKLKAELAPYSITVNDLLIDNIHFDDAFTKAIEAKQVNTQNAQAEQNNVAVAQAQAQQKVEKARGDSQAISIVQQALSQSPEYVRFLEAQKFSQSWDGHLPQVVGSGSPLITLPSTPAK